MPCLTRQRQSDKCSVKPLWMSESQCKGEQNIGAAYFYPEASISNRDMENLVLVILVSNSSLYVQRTY